MNTIISLRAIMIKRGDENRKEYDKKVEQYIAELEALHVKEDNTEKKFNDILLDNESILSVSIDEGLVERLRKTIHIFVNT